MAASDGGHVWPPRSTDPRILELCGTADPRLATPDDCFIALRALGYVGSLDDMFHQWKVANSYDTSEPFTTVSTPQPEWTNVQFLANLDGADAYTTHTEQSQNADPSNSRGPSGVGDTAQFKFGTASWYTTGPATQSDLDFGSLVARRPGNQDFCMEGWVRLETLPSTHAGGGYLGYHLWGIWVSTFDNRLFRLVIDEDDDLFFEASTSGTAATHTAKQAPASAFVVDTWYHLAVSRDDTTLRMFKDGNMEYENTSFFTTGQSLKAPTIATDYWMIGCGAGGNIAQDKSSNAWIDEVRYTLGEPLYTQNFTAPTEAFPTS